MKKLIILALMPAIFFLVACVKNPGEEGAPPSTQSVYTGHSFESNFSSHQIRYVGMPNENTMSFAGHYREAVNVYFPKTTKIIFVDRCSFFIHYVNTEVARMEFLSCGKQ